MIARALFVIALVVAVAGVSQAQRLEVPPPSGRTCSAMPVSETGKALADLIRKLEGDVKRDTELLRDLDRRFKSNNRELERLGNTACQQRAELQQRVITDTFGAAFTGLKALNERDTTLVLKSLTTNQNRQTILNILENRVATLSGTAKEQAEAAIKVIRSGYEGHDLRTARLAFDGLEFAYKTGVAMAPPFTCPGSDEAPEWNPATKVLTTSLRQILGEVNPAFKLLDPILDEDNWIAAITYFTTRNRIDQFNELNVTQLDEWKAHTCNLQRHAQTLRNARAKLAAPTPTVTTNGGAVAQSGSNIGKIAGAAVAGGGALAGLLYYQKAKAENEALLRDIANLPVTNNNPVTPPAATGVRAYDGTYDMIVTTTGPGGTQTDRRLTQFLIINNGVVTSTARDLNGQVTSNGGFTAVGACPINNDPADYTGSMLTNGSGSGTYRCRTGGISRGWRADNRR